jgi:hypothetical protein
MPDAPKELTPQEAAQIRLDNQYEKYKKATASKGDLADLLRAGKISEQGAVAYEEKAAELPPKTVCGLTRLATWIQSVYKLTCSKQIIKGWQKETPPFPMSAGADYRYRWADVAEWVERYKVKPLANTNSAELAAKLVPAQLEGQLEVLAHEKVMREVEAGLYLKKADIARACQGIGKTINGVINNRLELRLRVAAIERLNQRPAEPPLTPEQSAHVIELFCELGRETSATLKSELRSAMNQLSDEQPSA